MLRDILKKLSKYSTYIKLSVSILFLYVLLTKFVRLQSLLLVTNIEPSTLLICLCFTLLSCIFRSLRWKCILDMMGYNINFLYSVKLYLIGLYYGSVSPARIGEFVRGYYLSKKGIQPKEGIASVLYERLYDITTPLSFVGIYSLMHTKEVPLSVLLIITYAFTIILWFFFLYFFQTFKVKIPYIKDIDDIHLNLKFSCKLIGIPALLSLLNWMCFSVIAYYLLNSLNIHIGFTYIMFAYSVAILSVLLPISIGGWGVREGVYVWLLSPFSEPSVSIIFSIIFVIVTTYFLALLGLVSDWVIKHDKQP